MSMTTTRGVFLPDEQEQQITKKPPQSVRPTAHGSAGTQSTVLGVEFRNLNEQELKAAIKSEWKRHEELARTDLAPLLYWLREKLRAQGSRNDIHDKDRGFAAWVEENLDISRRTADRWCEWFAEKAGLKPSTSGHVSKSEADFFAGILDEHKGDQQIAFNCWVKKAVHAQFTKALATIQKQFGLKNKKAAMVQGVIYAATAINREAKSGSSPRVVGQLPLRHHEPKTRGHLQVRARVRSFHGGGKAKGHVQMVARRQSKSGHPEMVSRTHGPRGTSGPKAMRATAGR